MTAMNYAAAGISFGSTLEAARSKSNSAKYNAEVATNAADEIHSQGVAAGQSLDRSIRRSVGAAHAAYGGSGIDMSTGSPLNVLADAARQGTLDKLTLKHNFDTKETTYRDQAKLYRIGAENAIRAGFIAAVSNSLSSFMSGQVSSNPNSVGNSDASASWSGGSSLTGGMFTGAGSTATSWGGSSGQWSGGNSLTGGEYTGEGSTSTSWGGSSSGSWM